MAVSKPIDIHTEVLVVGAGPLGCTFARTLVDAGKSVFMIDAGPQLSPRPGWHLKNSYQFQRDINQFTGVIKAHLQTLSVPSDTSVVPTLDPAAFKVNPQKYHGFVGNNQNPDQDPYYNLPDAAATYAVGGMATHWTACTPREHPDIERSDLLPSNEWDSLYEQAEEILNTNQTMFEDSIRNEVVKKTLRETYPLLNQDANRPQNLPLAGKRISHNLITWSGGDTVLGDKLIKMLETPDSKFILKPSWQCTKLVCAEGGRRIQYAVVKKLLENETCYIHARTFVIAAGAVLTPQILFNSGIRPHALGHYLCEQPMAFCQIVLLQSIIDEIAHNTKCKEFMKAEPIDPIPIPLDDPTPQCWIPVSEGRPWHCQIHRDAFSYGEVAPNIDQRLIVDLRWFGMMKPSYKNCVTFSEKINDTFGMPQPTFHVQMDQEDSERAHKMMKDMLKAAAALGGFLPGSEPSFQKPGLSLHITGTCRMGKDKETSVVNTSSRVWDFDNLYLGSCGVIPTGTACNPTLTAMALAIHASKDIIHGM